MSKNLLERSSCTKNSAKKLLPLFSDFYRCFFVRRLHHDKLSTLRAGLAFQLQILRACCPNVMARFCNHKLKKFCRKDIFFAKKSDAKQHMCSKLLKKHKIVQFEKSCRSNVVSKSGDSRCCGFFG